MTLTSRVRKKESTLSVTKHVYVYQNYDCHKQIGRATTDMGPCYNCSMAAVLFKTKNACSWCNKNKAWSKSRWWFEKVSLLFPFIYHMAQIKNTPKSSLMVWTIFCCMDWVQSLLWRAGWQQTITWNVWLTRSIPLYKHNYTQSPAVFADRFKENETDFHNLTSPTQSLDQNLIQNLSGTLWRTASAFLNELEAVIIEG